MAGSSCCCSCFPAAECAIALINQIATTLFPPRSLPKLDFAKGVPADFTTMVVVPTLLTSEAADDARWCATWKFASWRIATRTCILRC